MAVYRRQFQPYQGSLTPHWQRFLVIPRYALPKVFAKKWFTGYYVLSFVPTLVFAMGIYLATNLNLMAMLGLQIEDAAKVDHQFFFSYQATVAVFSYFTLLFVSPTLVAQDLVNNALPAYLSRPFNKLDYVLGKGSVLFLLTSLPSLGTGLLLFLLAAVSMPEGWWWTNLQLLWAIVLGNLLFLTFFIVVALSLSAWLKWKSLASFSFFALPTLLAGMGEAFNALLRSTVGNYLDVGELMASLWSVLYETPNFSHHVSPWTALISLVLFAFLAILLLFRRLTAYEVIQ